MMLFHFIFAIFFTLIFIPVRDDDKDYGKDKEVNRGWTSIFLCMAAVSFRIRHLCDLCVLCEIFSLAKFAKSAEMFNHETLGLHESTYGVDSFILSKRIDPNMNGIPLWNQPLYSSSERSERL